MVYDLEERTLRFAKLLIHTVKMIPETMVTRSMISQCIRSGTSVGANYREANAAVSKNDFRNKISICRKEIHETKYWLELLADTVSKYKAPLRPVWSEAHELSLIFNKIFYSLKNKQ